MHAVNEEKQEERIKKEKKKGKKKRSTTIPLSTIIRLSIPAQALFS